MIKDLFKLLTHNWIWSGDKIRLYRRTFHIGEAGNIYHSDNFIGEFYVKVEDGAVRVPDHHPYAAIRRDLPKWSGRHQCWEYFYTEGSGS